jgi:hypothetical protein
MTHRQPIRCELWPRSRGPLPLDYAPRRCRGSLWCWRRLAVRKTLQGNPYCPDCHERWQEREDARIAELAAAAEAVEAAKARWHAIARARIAGTPFEPQPEMWDRF